MQEGLPTMPEGLPTMRKAYQPCLCMLSESGLRSPPCRYSRSSSGVCRIRELQPMNSQCSPRTKNGIPELSISPCSAQKFLSRKSRESRHPIQAYRTKNEKG
jgi:hypothetical protein